MTIKQIITAVAIAAASMAASAEVLADVETQSGGTIKLTDALCPSNNKLMHAVITAANGRFLWGCWTIFDGNVVVIWEDGDKNMYPLKAFRIRDTMRKYKPSPAL